MSRSRRIVNNKVPTQIPQESKAAAGKVVSLFGPSNDDIPQFFFSNPNWMQGARVRGGVTTFLKDPEQYAEKTAIILTSLLPKLMSDWDSLYPSPNRHQYAHCHSLRDDALLRAKDVIRKIYGESLDVESEYMKNIWQFGFSQGVRLICGVSGRNKIYPLFVDYHHLLFPNDHYNEHDYETYRFCPKHMIEMEEEVREETAVSSVLYISQEQLYEAMGDMCDACVERLEDLI